MPDRLAIGWFTLGIWASAALVTAMLSWIVIDLAWHGISHLSLEFLFTPPADAGRAGGISSILVSTLLILSVAVLTAVPIGLGAAVWLSEYSRWRSCPGAAARMTLDVLAGVPSIVFGLFGNAFFSVYLGLGFSILAGGLTLACMILPVFIRTCELGLSAVSDDWRHAAGALGMSRASAVWHVLLPAAAPAVLAGLMLGVGRATAETAALIFTSGYVDRMPSSLLDSGRALAVHVYDLAMNVTGGDGAAYASALVLVAAIILINVGVFDLSNRLLARRVSTV